MMFWKKKQFWASLFGLALLAYCLKEIRLDELEDMAQRINIYYIIPAVVCSFVYLIARGLRWRMIVSHQKIIAPVRAVTLFSTGQVLNIAMPALTGQLGRIFLFSGKEGLKKTFVFSTIVLEVLFDAISLVVVIIITSLVWPFPGEYRPASMIIIGVTLGALIALYAVLHYQVQLDALGRKWLRGRWPGLYIVIKKFMRTFTGGIELLRRGHHVLRGMFWSLGTWAAHLLAIYFLLLAFGLPLTLWSAAFIMIVNTLAMMVPLTPGNAGTFEIVVSTTLLAFSVPRSDAIMFALALHIVDLLPMFILGFIFLHVERMELRVLRRENQDKSLLDRISEEGTFVEEEMI